MPYPTHGGQAVERGPIASIDRLIMPRPDAGSSALWWIAAVVPGPFDLASALSQQPARKRTGCLYPGRFARFAMRGSAG